MRKKSPKQKDQTISGFIPERTKDRVLKDVHIPTCVMIASYCWGKMPKVQFVRLLHFRFCAETVSRQGASCLAKLIFSKTGSSNSKRHQDSTLSSKVMTRLSPTCTGLPPKDPTTSQVLKCMAHLILGNLTV